MCGIAGWGAQEGGGEELGGGGCGGRDVFGGMIDEEYGRCEWRKGCKDVSTGSGVNGEGSEV